MRTATTRLTAAAAVALIAAAAAPARSTPDDDRAYVGIQMAPIEAERDGAKVAAIRLNDVLPDTGAARAGLARGDLILGIGGLPFTVGPDQVIDAFRAALTGKKPGDTLELLVLKTHTRLDVTRNALPVEDPDAILGDLRGWLERQPPGTSVEAKGVRSARVEKVTVVLGKRPLTAGAVAVPKNESMFGGRRFEAPFAPLVDAWIAREGAAEDTEDLRARLAALHETGDLFRLGLVAYVHRDPFALHGIATDLETDVARASRGGDLAALLELAGRRGELRPPGGPAPEPPSLTAERTLEEHLKLLEETITEAALHVHRAFAALSEEERAHLIAHHRGITERFEQHIYLHDDPDEARRARNQHTLIAALRVDRGELIAAARVAARIADPSYLAALRRDLERGGHDLGKDMIAWRGTPYGNIIIGGTASTWFRDGHDAAVMIDLGGDDFYSATAGGSIPGKLPVSVLCDLGGDDSYESTRDGVQGTGVLGVGLLVDAAGNDHYIAPRIAQGSAYFGVGVLIDRAGDDVYRGHAFAQGTALFGAGILCDLAGNDRYESHTLSQSVAMPGGVAVLSDLAGDDSYYAKGTYQTSYGEVGIFEGWSQGCAVGFRTLASGGLAVLLDGAGADRFEAGNFSQGGGYFYGLGALFAGGDGDDLYIGSRYAQGFSAHQAVGAFIERGGDDRYTTRHAVAQGLAWDQCVSLFVDDAGDDVYDGGGSFSQGATAHNAITVFWDRGGRDRYAAGQPVARAGPNTYHGGEAQGGSSLSIFIDEGGEVDVFGKHEAPGPAAVRNGKHGFAADLTGSVAAAIARLHAEGPPPPPEKPSRHH